MKRLGVYAFIAIILIGTIGGFTHPEKAFAQNTVTVEQILQHASPIIDEKILALNNEMKLFGSTHGDKNSTEYKEYVQTNAAEIAMVRVAKGVFETTLTAKSTRTPTELYGDALVATSRSLVDQQSSNPILKRPQADDFIRKFRQELMAEALSQERIRAITTGKALSAEAQANAVASKESANPGSKTISGGCRWNNFTVSACIDEGFSWLIKNTFLQMAGFLAWLSANMLNYAIQISILDFAKWSPTASIYSVWVIIRQIVSLVVVFAGLYLGFMYIIGREDTFGKYIGWLVIFALFVNFSYPITRALVDVSNIVSLNIYSSAVGSEALGSSFGSAVTTSGGNTAGSLIVSKLGLTDLFVSATTVTAESGFNVKTGSGFVGQINTTPGALAAVAFALCAAFVLFMCTWLLVMRSAVLAFLIVASPLLLVDAVVPKLGDVAVKMRKMFFEQLIVAPVFMLMLALTLRFMDVFQTGPLANGGDSVKVFFNLLMMTIMLMIMLKVTKAAAGTAGEMATNFMGKVGGFGLGVATGGAGLLARGTVGMAAARMRDSDWMKNKQDSRTGRGLFSLTNSLAQSTFDAKNIGMVNRGMASAGMGMGAGSTKTYDKNFQERKTATQAKASYIKDAGVRDRYLNQMTNTIGSRAQRGTLKVFGLSGKEGRSDAEIIKESLENGKQKIIDRYNNTADPDKKQEYLESQSEDMQTILKNQAGSARPNPTTSKGPSVDLDKAGLVPKEGEASEESPVNVDDIHSTSFRAGVRSKKFDTSNATTVTPKNTPEAETV